MTEKTENLVLEHLRAMRGDIGDIKGRLDRMDLRLSAIEQTIGSLYATITTTIAIPISMHPTRRSK